MLRRTYCLELAYDGSNFFGWQSQPHGNTIQDIIETALATMLGETVRLVPASRTDTGVARSSTIRDLSGFTRNNT